MNNVLIHSRSPYLQQHAHNPVHWQIWSDKAFELAQRNNKPVLISIGYATCYWCHVMERESFSQLSIADYMNEHFVCIKVDREEHPEVDQFYMDALQTMTGMGGWPLNVFVTPDRKPFYGGTYFPPSSQYGRMGWMDLLERIQYNWLENKENIVLQGDQLVRHLNNATKVETFVFDFDKIDVDRVNSIVLQHADVMFGGFGNAPKFPNFSVLKWLLFSAQIKADKEVETLLAISIKALVNKGIYDHVEGGIARYTTDREWNVPHFEKMLYDNAQLLQVLTDYYAISKDGLIRGKITQTVRFFIDVFFQKGLFGSALNAESGGVEGAYYTFTGDELERSEFTTNTIFQSYYNLKKRGNWEGTNIPYVTGEREEFLVNNNLKLDEFNLLIDKGLNALMGIKKERIKPLYDFKKQLSWNAMMHIGLIKVQQVEQDVALVDILKLHMHTMQSQFLDEGQHLQHIVYDDGQSIQAQLDDYAYFIQSLLLHRELTSDDASLILAKRLMEQSILYFGDGEDVYFYYTKSDNSEVLVRKINILDTDYEAANAIMAYNLYLLGIIFEENSWIYRAELMVQRVLNSAVKHPLSLSSWLKLGIQFKQKFKILSHSNKDFKHSLVKVDFPYLAYFVEKESEEIPVFAQTLFKKENKYIACDKDSCVEVLVLDE